MLNSSQSKILEFLHTKRSGKIDESVNPSVRGSVGTFFDEQRTPSQIRKRINNILNLIYFKCNVLGDNTFVGGTYDYSRGQLKGKESEENGPDPMKSLSLEEVVFQVKFVENLDPDIILKKLFDFLKKEAKDSSEDISADQFSILIGVDLGVDDSVGYYISIERSGRGFVVRVGHQKSPFLNESAKKAIKYFRGKNPWDKFRFEFSSYKSKKDGEMKIRVDMRNEYWDSGDYAFLSSYSPDIDSMTSYSGQSARTVKNALRAAGYDVNSLLKIKDELRITEGKLKDLSEVPYIGKIERPEDDEDDSNNDSDESSTGVFGTEIGLPIDKENCESTGVSGVSTPTGTLNHKKKVVEGYDSEDTKDLTIICPECNSQIVNIRDFNIFHCSDCGYEWNFTEEEGRDGMLDNTEDEDPIHVNNVSGTFNNIYSNPKSDPRFNT